MFEHRKMSKTMLCSEMILWDKGNLPPVTLQYYLNFSTKMIPSYRSTLCDVNKNIMKWLEVKFLLTGNSQKNRTVKNTLNKIVCA